MLVVWQAHEAFSALPLPPPETSSLPPPPPQTIQRTRSEKNCSESYTLASICACIYSVSESFLPVCATGTRLEIAFRMSTNFTTTTTTTKSYSFASLLVGVWYVTLERFLLKQIMERARVYSLTSGNRTFPRWNIWVYLGRCRNSQRANARTPHRCSPRRPDGTSKPSDASGTSYRMSRCSSSIPVEEKRQQRRLLLM